ncbi:MAG TPA: hypothetical protein VJ508_03825, partial [Saprospiraceae bacterium]|nr:hypothetical protein [Saprospiraceae bacterium]
MKSPALSHFPILRRPAWPLFLVIATSILYLGCEHEYVQDLDKELISALNLHSKTGSFQAYILPESDDYAHLPNQDVKNPVTEAKVQLGKLLF